MIFFIGPESQVYHSRRDCPRLNNAYRYYPIVQAESWPPPDVDRLRERARRLCRDCAKRDAKAAA